MHMGIAEVSNRPDSALGPNIAGTGTLPLRVLLILTPSQIWVIRRRWHLIRMGSGGWVHLPCFDTMSQVSMWRL